MANEQTKTDSFVEYSYKLLNGSFDRWTSDAISGYKTALISLTEFYKKNVQQENKELKAWSEKQNSFIDKLGQESAKLEHENKELRPALADTLFVCQEYDQELNGQKEQGKLNAAGLKFHQQVKQVIRNAQGLLVNADHYESIHERENKELKEQRDELLKVLSEINEACTGGIINQDWCKSFTQQYLGKRD